MPHPAALPPEQLLKDCQMRLTRRSGPGGQHRNKVETAVVLLHRPSGVRAEAAERRSQAQNRRVALFRLRLNLALEARAERAADEVPSPLWLSRCAGGRVSVSPSHADFPAVLAEALDTLSAHDMDPKQAATALGCTVSQFVKLLKKEPRALASVNRHRQEHRLRPLQ